MFAEILEAFDDLLYDLQHNTPPAEADAEYRAVWGDTLERVQFARDKLREAGERVVEIEVIQT